MANFQVMNSANDSHVYSGSNSVLRHLEWWNAANNGPINNRWRIKVNLREFLWILYRVRTWEFDVSLTYYNGSMSRVWETDDLAWVNNENVPNIGESLVASRLLYTDSGCPYFYKNFGNNTLFGYELINCRAGLQTHYVENGWVNTTPLNIANATNINISMSLLISFRGKNNYFQNSAGENQFSRLVGNLTMTINARELIIPIYSSRSDSTFSGTLKPKTFWDYDNNYSPNSGAVQ